MTEDLYYGKPKLYMTQTRVLDEYVLTLKDLKDVEFKSSRNAHQSFSKLYLITTVKEIALKKHNIQNIEDLVEIRNKKILKKSIRSTKMKESVACAINLRKTNLIKKLKELGLTLRNDSKLCTEYINGTLKDWTVEQIAHRMCQMKYLFDYCDMSQCLEQASKEQNDELTAGYFPDMTVFDQAEYIALKNKKYPTIFPWILKKKQKQYNKILNFVIIPELTNIILSFVLLNFQKNKNANIR